MSFRKQYDMSPRRDKGESKLRMDRSRITTRITGNSSIFIIDLTIFPPWNVYFQTQACLPEKGRKLTM
jgi:hypothetical protein